MLIEMNTIITKTYYLSSNFYVDIIKDIMTNYYQAWIWNGNYGIKDHMFSVPMEQQTYDEFLDIVFNNINEYRNFYVDDHFTFEERKKFYANNIN